MPRHILYIACSFFISAAAMAQVATVKDEPPKPGSPKVLQTPVLGEAVEKQLLPDGKFTPWVQDESTLPALEGDRVEVQQVLEKNVKTIKLPNVVPPVLFGSGEAKIPDAYIGRVRKILDGMKDRKNVRLHLVGHTDNVQLIGEAKVQYGDNTGLARERAGVAAEFFQKALNLPAESVTYEGRGETQPVASNATAAGRSLNRRMEVEVWYDEIEEKLVDKQVVVPENVKRIKVCRVEQMCKISYKAGHSKRTRVKNLIPPFHYSDDSNVVPTEYQQKLLQVLGDLGDKRGVVVKFIGYTDNTPLTGRDERIYANHLGISKARARRVALALQDALKLPASAVESDGKGATNPLAPNDTETGRKANRRVEVEFWYDDALQVMTSEPQLCPEAAGEETVTRVYNSPNTTIKPLVYENGKPVIPAGYAQNVASVLAEVTGKTHVRLRYIGYTNNDRLDRRTALAYGDDIGLSAARARVVMDTLQPQLGLKPEEGEHEGRGYIQSADVVANGFAESEVSRVEVQVVYDELAALDDLDGLDIERLTRDVKVVNPYALNLMRITVDGKPLDDPGKSIPDVQRCTDVALEKANIQFKYDNLNLKPRLNVTAWPNSIRFQDDPATDFRDDQVDFKTYSNFSGFIARSEIRIFDAEKSLRDEPLAVVPVDENGRAAWQADFTDYSAPGRNLKYVLRVYDKEAKFSETASQALWVVDKRAADATDQNIEKELLVGYGENRLAVQNIDLHGGTVKVYGSNIPEGHAVSVAGRSVPVAASGEFAVEEILPQGMHSVEVSVLDKAGNGDMYLRDLELEKTDWFYVAIADVTASRNMTKGPAELVSNEQGHYDDNLSLGGRLAFFTTGKFGDQWQLTASADTLEGPVKDLFSNFMQKTPDAMFRRINPDYYYPTYGDDSTSEEAAPTLGKFYAKLKKRNHFGLWGNFKLGYTDNSLAHVDRTLYGANLHFEPSDTTAFGEKRLVLDGFAAEPGTVAARDEYRGTGGSLYYLRHQDIMSGSERVRIEIRDKASGMVVGAKTLVGVQDYTVDYLQGRVLLSSPLSPVASDNLLVVSDVSPGNEAYLVVQYEYSTGFEELDNLSTGGRVHYWVGDHVKLGVTGNKNTDPGAENTLAAVDITLRKTASTWVKIETGASTGPGTTSFDSNDGGFNFTPTSSTTTLAGPTDGRQGASRIDASLGIKDVYEGGNGTATFYTQSVDAGYSAPGLLTRTDVEQYGGSVKTSVTDKTGLKLKLDKKSQELALETSAVELDVDHKLNEHWTLSSGVRKDSRTDHSPVVPLTQVQGDRTDIVVRAGYDSQETWAAYGYLQDTASTSGNRETNSRFGSGGSYRINDRLKVNGEVSGGDMGLGARLGTEYLYSDRTSTYLNYALENERSDNGVRANKGNMVAGVKSHYSDTTSVFFEEKYSHGDAPTGLMHSTGVDYAPNDRWNFSTHIDSGSLRDNLTGAEMKRSGFGVSMGYGGDTGLKLASLFEYRRDQVQSATDLSYSNRKNWLTKNSLKYQINPDSRFIGKLNYSVSKSSLGEFYDGSYTEAVVGYGYRPVANDRLNLLLKYTYFYNLPSTGQVLVPNTAASFIQKSHIFSVDAIYDLTRNWSVGGKYAHKVGQVSQDRVDPVFFDSTADLYIARVDWHMVRQWDLTVEGRVLSIPQAEDVRSGALVGVYRHLSNHIKIGAGWNFTDFSDDLTNLSYTHQGVFINLVGKF
jgi:flagellar motor protein MotB